MTTEKKKLYRIPNQKMIAGVAAGFADYFNTDLTVMRVLFVVAALLTDGIGIIVYLVLAITLPIKEASSSRQDAPEGEVVGEKKNHSTRDGSDARTYIGAGLIILGFWILISQLFPQLFTFSWTYIWPLLIVALGAWLIVRSKN